MKTIEVTDEQYDRLKHMAELMETQDNRATRLPLYHVYQIEERRCDIDDSQEVAYFANTYDFFEVAHSSDELVEWFKNKEEVMDNCDITSEQYDAIDGDDPGEIAGDLGLTQFGWEEVRVPVPGEIFLTEEAAQKHIDSFGYHYNKPYIYVVSAWRNPELETVMDVVAQITNPEGARR